MYRLSKIILTTLPQISEGCPAKSDKFASNLYTTLKNGVRVVCDTDTEGGRWVVFQVGGLFLTGGWSFSYRWVVFFFQVGGLTISDGW